MARIRVVVLGACGNMGRETVKMVLGTPSLKLAGAVDRSRAGEDAGSVAGALPCGIPVTERLPDGLSGSNPLSGRDPVVAVDFTHPDTAVANALQCIGRGFPTIVGTTGLDEEDVVTLRGRAEAAGLGVLLAPNFAIGAVLMMRFARIAARYMRSAEILEQHHDRKVDAPSGTALMTAQIISEVLRQSSKEKVKELLKLQGARGGNLDGVAIHSMRLPGFLAHHTVIFGDVGQTLTLRHDSINRESFMPGVRLGIDEIVHVRGLVVGLENLMRWD